MRFVAAARGPGTSARQSTMNTNDDLQSEGMKSLSLPAG